MERRVKTSTRRTYRSELRQRQAEETRAGILRAVDELLAEGGLSTLTIREVARRAGVAPETVYAAFGSKGKLVEALGRANLAAAVEGGSSASLLEELVDAEALEDQLALLARIGPEVMGRNWRVLEAMRQAGETEPELREMYDRASEGRRDWMRRLARGWRKRGVLRRGRGVESTADALWALTSPEMYRLLVVEAGWSDRHYGRWLARAMSAVALGDEGAGASG